MKIILAVPNPDFNSSKNWMQGTSTGKLYIQGKKNMVSCPSTQSIDFKENNSKSTTFLLVIYPPVIKRSYGKSQFIRAINIIMFITHIYETWLP